jgi:hypothetical protein
MYNLPQVTLSSVELSDLFFNYHLLSQFTVEQSAEDFLNMMPSIKNAGVTIEMLVKDYNDRV